MSQFVKLLVVIVSVSYASMARQAHGTTVLNFDDVPGGSIQNSDFAVFEYKGFDFTGNLFWIDVEGSFEHDWAFGAHSGDFALLCNFGDFGVVKDATGADFTFDGLWAKRWRMAPESGGDDSLFGYLAGRKDGQEVWRIDTGLNGSYKYFGPQAGTIDELILGFGRAEPLGTWLIDDMVLNARGVPEPTTGTCALLAVAGMLLAVRRR